MKCSFTDILKTKVDLTRKKRKNGRRTTLLPIPEAFLILFSTVLLSGLTPIFLLALKKNSVCQNHRFFFIDALFFAKTRTLLLPDALIPQSSLLLSNQFNLQRLLRSLFTQEGKNRKNQPENLTDVY